MPKRKTQKEVITEFNIVHANNYNYSKVNYKNTSSKVIVICSIHGEFSIAPSHHKNGVGCRKCYFESQKITKEEFIQRSKNKFGNRYDYSLFYKMPEGRKKVKIKCKEHDVIFLQDPKNHMLGHTGCPKCHSNILSGNSHNRGKFKTQEELNKDFIDRATIIHSDKYDYKQFVYVNNGTRGKITCKKHGEFFQAPSNHLKGSQCPDCTVERKKSGTFKELCKSKGVDYYRALKRRQAGLSEEKIFSKGYIRSTQEINKIAVFGEIYPNLEEAIRKLKPPASNTTISRWINSGKISAEDAFERIPNPGYAEGIIYLVTNKITKKQYVGLTIQTIERRWIYHVEQAKAGYIKHKDSLHTSIKEYGKELFIIEKIDNGTTKKDLESKECYWIKKINTLIPNGYNISKGGVSGGSNKKPTMIDNILFKGVAEAAKYLAKTKNISISAAKKRISTGKIHVKKRAKKGESLVYTKTYKVWSRIVHCVLNPKSKGYMNGIDIFENWKDFDKFYNDVGEPKSKNMAFSRLDKTKGFFPENCMWLTKSKSSKINAKYMKKMGLLTGRKSLTNKKA